MKLKVELVGEKIGRERDIAQVCDRFDKGRILNYFQQSLIFLLFSLTIEGGLENEQ